MSRGFKGRCPPLVMFGQNVWNYLNTSVLQLQQFEQVINFELQTNFYNLLKIEHVRPSSYKLLIATLQSSTTLHYKTKTWSLQLLITIIHNDFIVTIFCDNQSGPITTLWLLNSSWGMIRIKLSRRVQNPTGW